MNSGPLRDSNLVRALNGTISPLEFLVLPRVTALFLMIPLLCIFADCMGILGGAFVAARQVTAPSDKTSVPTVRRDTSAIYEPVYCDNFA